MTESSKYVLSSNPEHYQDFNDEALKSNHQAMLEHVISLVNQRDELTTVGELPSGVAQSLFFRRTRICRIEDRTRVFQRFPLER